MGDALDRLNAMYGDGPKLEDIRERMVDHLEQYYPEFRWDVSVITDSDGVTYKVAAVPKSLWGQYIQLNIEKADPNV